tara:strand:- start:3684 stop:4418 length:735 start_codon:yes stop_codon:yes gene_type:complete
MTIENSKEIVSIIQARMSSTRLPGKVLLPLGNATVLDEVIKKARLFSKKVVVCTSTDKSDNELENYCGQKNIVCVRGDLDNVFSRYQKAFDIGELENFKWFARVTADNPLISVNLAKDLINRIKPDLDYIAFCKKIPNGSGIELINTKTFLNINSEILEDAEKEHVTPIFYEKLNEFNSLIVEPNDFYRVSELRVTLDYKEDYQLLKKLFNLNSSISLEEVIELFKKDSSLFKFNKNCRQKKIR